MAYLTGVSTGNALARAMSKGNKNSLLELRELESVYFRALGQPPSVATAWHYRTKFPWPLADRDVCHLNCWSVVRSPEGQRRQLVVDSSIDHPDGPSRGSDVRMQLKLIFCLEDESRNSPNRGAPSCRMTVCAELDLGGDIPSSVVNRAIAQVRVHRLSCCNPA
jgi:hypothetical protein